MTFDTDFFRRRIAASLPSRSALPSAEETPRPEGNPQAHSVLDVSQLFDLKGTDEFLHQAYRMVLERDCDANAFVHFRALIRHGASRQDVLDQLCRSDEARARNMTFTYNHRRRGFVATRWKSLLIRMRAFASGLFRKSAASVARLFFWQLEVLEDKLDFLVQAEEARNGLLASKLDSPLRLLTEKLDAYSQDLNSRMSLLEETINIGNQQYASITDVQAPQSQIIDELRAMETHMSRILAEISREVSITATASRSFSHTCAIAEARAARDYAEIVETLRQLSSQVGATKTQCDLSSPLAEVTQGLVSRSEQIQAVQCQLKEAVEQSAGAFAAGVSTYRDFLNNVLRQLADLKGELHSMVTCTEVDGFIVGVPSAEWRVVAYHRHRGNMEPGLTKHFRSLLREGMTVVDAGANLGLYTLHAARLVGTTGRVHSIEPSPRTWKLLKDNIQINSLMESGIVQTHQVALSNCIGEASLAIYNDKSGHNTLYPYGPPDGMALVSVVTLDALLQNEQHVDVVKIDVEGAEALVFEGMTEVIDRNPAICVLMEFSPDQLAHAGTNPGHFLRKLAEDNWDIEIINDESGTPSRVPIDQLLGVFTCNLSLRRTLR